MFVTVVTNTSVGVVGVELLSSGLVVDVSSELVVSSVASGGGRVRISLSII